MKINTNNVSWTQVLSGAGFVISKQKIRYNFDTQLDTDSFIILPNNQVNGLDGKILYAKSVSSFSEVSSVGE